MPDLNSFATPYVANCSHVISFLEKARNFDTVGDIFSFSFPTYVYFMLTLAKDLLALMDWF
jgi:hypothetical protein